MHRKQAVEETHLVAKVILAIIYRKGPSEMTDAYRFMTQNYKGRHLEIKIKMSFLHYALFL
jgi:hypothetical protein